MCINSFTDERVARNNNLWKTFSKRRTSVAKTKCWMIPPLCLQQDLIQRNLSHLMRTAGLVLGAPQMKTRNPLTKTSKQIRTATSPKSTTLHMKVRVAEAEQVR